MSSSKNQRKVLKIRILKEDWYEGKKAKWRLEEK